MQETENVRKECHEIIDLIPDAEIATFLTAFKNLREPTLEADPNRPDLYRVKSYDKWIKAFDNASNRK